MPDPHPDPFRDLFLDAIAGNDDLGRPLFAFLSASPDHEPANMPKTHQTSAPRNATVRGLAGSARKLDPDAIASNAGREIEAEWFEMQLDFLRQRASECGLRVEIAADGKIMVFERSGGGEICGTREIGVSMGVAWSIISASPRKSSKPILFDLDSDIPF